MKLSPSPPKTTSEISKEASAKAAKRLNCSIEDLKSYRQDVDPIYGDGGVMARQIFADQNDLSHVVEIDYDHDGGYLVNDWVE